MPYTDSANADPIPIADLRVNERIRFAGGKIHKVLDIERMDDEFIRVAMYDVDRPTDEAYPFAVDFAPDTEVWKVVR